ncbi:flagellar hook-associated protein FlgL [Evansella sp. AB-P1]|uniref:flagellar hook-associated protein FlgL n=1 Tax=Evansella sp. AB-P1 TaxID=3037653 RepID=UPI00241F6A36|nr:flagellar hook-associated protein FlgL [Evansella sp. AB-P1]MDG5786674.1 flagellar hook-associated protein FlgL [Evansella sp. AB-P1]
MRVTQPMLSNSSLRHLSQSYQTLHTLQNQLATGKKITRASQDPVVAMNGMRYRTQVTEITQFERNLSETYNWMDNGDAALDQVTNAMHRVRELAVQASNDTYEASQRDNIAKEIRQLLEHVESLANTKSNSKFIFNGTNTTNPPVNPEAFNLKFEDIANDFQGIGDGEYEKGDFPIELTFSSGTYHLHSKDGDTYVFQHADHPRPDKMITMTVGEEIDEDTDEVTFNLDAIQYSHNGETSELKEREIIFFGADAVSTNEQDVKIELLKGVTIPINIRPDNVFSKDFFGDIIQLENALKDPETTGEELTRHLQNFDNQINKVVNERAELGARLNRVEMIEDRVRDQEVIAKRTMSENEDADIEKVITELLMAENVHMAALSSMARIMQPSLMDFLR